LNQSYRLNSGGRIDRSKPLRFTFNGKSYQGYAGDTLASALLANGVRIVGRSFKYHRPRGIVGSGAEEPNAILQIGEGAKTVPNLRATQVELVDGLVARSVNGWPSLENDASAITGNLSRLLPAGFYYKTFMWPKSAWEKYEHFIRKAAGLGESPSLPDPDRYEKVNIYCDVLIAGAGPAGLVAALSAGRAGARVVIADEQNEFGGSLLASRNLIDEKPADEWIAHVVKELRQMPEVRCLPRSTVFGYHNDNFLTIHERVSDHLPNADRRLPRERVWRVRAKQVVLATGAIERPLVFGNNDRPGVMLASAASTYVNRYGVKPGTRAVVFTNNDSAYQTALDLQQADVIVSAIIDVRANPDGNLVNKARAAGIAIETSSVVTDVRFDKTITTAEISKVNNEGDAILGAPGSLGCDFIVMSGGWSPVVHLHAQSGGRPKFDDTKACFVPGDSVQHEQSIGAAHGVFSLREILDEGFQVGVDAARSTGFDLGATPASPIVEEIKEQAIQPMWLVPSEKTTSRAAKCFVDFQNDTTAADIQLAAREGYRSIEHVKRYTALGFGTDQGKLGNINGMAILATELGQSLGETGTTTFRPNYTPVSFGAIAGPDLGETLFDPVRKTAMHEWHVENGAKFENVGQWKRPWYYPKPGEDIHAAVNRECLAVRESVGILDASTLGKIDIYGPDAVALLNWMYTNAWSKLEIGRCRYGLMLGEDGMVMDDGVTSCLGEQHFHMTTTTGGAAHVMGWMERWLQTEWPDMQVYLTSTTDHWAVASISGPNSRKLIEELCVDIDFSNDAFPFMSFRDGTVVGLPARVFRISFSGELAYEINVSANAGRKLWEALMQTGEKYNITPYGTETMHVLRAEKGYIIVGQDTDGSMTPQDLGMDWICSKKKDYLGRRSLSRSDCVRDNRKQLVGLKPTNSKDVIPEGAQLVNEPSEQTPVPMIGHVTSSYYSATLGHSIALAVVKGGRARMGGTVYAPLLDGRTISATIADPVFYDAQGERQNV